MRHADSQNQWKKVYSREYRSQISAFGFSDLRAAGTGELALAGGINAICGNNGVGKTTLLRTVYNALIGVLPEVGSVQVAGACRGVPLSQSKPLSPDEVVLFEPSRHASRIQYALENTANIDELLAQYEEYRFDDKAVKEFGYVVGKDYTSVSMREVEGLLGDEVVPYFSVATGDGSYESGAMGLGELSVFLVLWKLEMLRAESFVLIEEPEGSLPPRAQVALANVFAKHSATKALWILLTTHSSVILESLGDNSITLLAGGSAHHKSRSGCLIHLGIPPFARGMLFVEDRFAESFLRQICEASQLSVASEFEIAPCGGDANAVRAATGLPANSARLRFAVILDGDCRVHSFDSDVAILILPGNLAPELLLIERVKTNESAFAVALGVEVPQVKLAISAASGIDHHDFFGEIAKGLGFDRSRVEHAAFRCWYLNRTVDENEQLAELLSHLKKMMHMGK